MCIYIFNRFVILKILLFFLLKYLEYFLHIFLLDCVQFNEFTFHQNNIFFFTLWQLSQSLIWQISLIILF